MWLLLQMKQELREMVNQHTNIEVEKDAVAKDLSLPMVVYIIISIISTLDTLILASKNASHFEVYQVD